MQNSPQVRAECVLAVCTVTKFYALHVAHTCTSSCERLPVLYMTLSSSISFLLRTHFPKVADQTQDLLLARHRRKHFGHLFGFVSRFWLSRNDVAKRKMTHFSILCSCKQNRKLLSDPPILGLMQHEYRDNPGKSLQFQKGDKFKMPDAYRGERHPRIRDTTDIPTLNKSTK